MPSLRLFLALSAAAWSRSAAGSRSNSIETPFFVVPPGASDGLAAGGSTRVGLAAGGFLQPEPLAVQTVSRNGTVSWTRGSYSSVNGSRASGTLVSPGGAAFLFVDVVTPCTLPGATAGSSGFCLSRVVTVVSARGGSDEVAFATRVSVPAPDGLASQRRQLFFPGVTYDNVSALPRGALAGDPLAASILVREDRLPLPFAAVVFPDAAGGTGVLVHVRPDGRTVAGDDFVERIVDGGLLYGSVGVVNDNAPASLDGAPPLPRPSLAFEYPGSEGDRTYVYDPAAGGWANRSHPLAAGFAQSYELLFSWEPSADSYFTAARRAWRGAFDLFAPAPPAPSPMPDRLYRDGVELLAHYAVAYSGVPSVPFEASLPSGDVVDTSSQMGFVGRALPCAALLLYDAVVAAPNATRRAQAEAVVDLWAARAPEPCGVVKTWYNIVPGGDIQWRASDAYQGSIRIMSDGMKGLLDAYVVSPRAAWLAAARAYGDFLVRAQAADGSVATAWDWSCAPLASDVHQTPHVVPFLAALFEATSDARYRDAALAAGHFSAALFNDSFTYTGGAVDNPDVPDREAGWLATQAFLSLHALTGDAAWLAPAAQAAAFTETFVYWWDVPIPCAQTPPDAFPCTRSTLGASLIATGQSGSDNYMSIASADYTFLGQALGDAHFTRVGGLLYAATSQMTDWDGRLGYDARGLLHEAATLSVRRGAGVSSWLPWLTANLLQPLVQANVTALYRAAAAARRGLGGR